MSVRLDHLPQSDSYYAVSHHLAQILSAQFQIAADGTLTVNGQLTGSVDAQVKALIDHPYEVTVSLVEDLPTGTLQSSWTRYAEAAPSWGVLDYQVQPGEMRIYYTPEYVDRTDHTNPVRKPFLVDVEGYSAKQSELPEIILLHMLSHAYDCLKGIPVLSWEGRALELENGYREREDKHYAKRANGLVSLPAGDPFTGMTYDLGGCGCFVATAAYGSPYEPEVASLRRFRDDLLLRTRTGAAFFARFYAQYYRFSPAIAELIDRDAALRDAARWGVTPIVRYLEIAQNFPAAELTGVPEPWRGFLMDVREKLEAWGTAIGLPDDFATLTPPEAAGELALALRYLLRSDDSREQYLQHLAAGGRIPIACDGEEYDACRRVLTGAGRPEHEFLRLFSHVREEARS